MKIQCRCCCNENSGTLGGTETKLTAAIKLGLEIVIIDRPRIDYKI